MVRGIPPRNKAGAWHAWERVGLGIPIPAADRFECKGEKVTLPSEDQYHVPQQFREEILEAMKHQHPRQYEKMVSQYYKELVK